MASIGGFFRALAVIWRMGDTLAPLLEQLEASLPAAGDALVVGGKMAGSVGRVLKQEGGDPINAQRVVGDMAAALQTSRDQLDGIVSKLRDVGDQLKRVGIPTVTPTYIHMDLGVWGQYDVVNGLTPGTLRPFDWVHDGLDQTADAVHNVREQVEAARKAMSDLSAAFGQAGSDLEVLGTSLADGGKALRGTGH